MVVSYVVYAGQIVLKIGQLQPNSSVTGLGLSMSHIGQAYELAVKDAESEKLLQNLDLR